MVRLLHHLKSFAQQKLGIKQLAEQQEHQIACQQEILKANLFRDIIYDSEWLKFKSFAPGGWAVDYGVMFTLYRVLNEMRPKNIIEFGLGQSSKLLHQYGNYYHDTKVVTIEHNSDWIGFFMAEVENKYPVQIQLLELENRIYQRVETIAYKDLEKVCEDEKYDFILVDGPYGSIHYSRNQLVDLAQDHLADRFCLILDDYNRCGEQETIEEVKKVLDAKRIDYFCAVYSASKKHCLICSKELAFLTTLYWF